MAQDKDKTKVVEKPVEEQLKETQDKLNEQLSKNTNLERMVTNLTEEVKWWQSEYDLTLSSLFKMLFKITSQVESADFQNVFENRKRELMQKMRRENTESKKPTA